MIQLISVALNARMPNGGNIFDAQTVTSLTVSGNTASINGGVAQQNYVPSYAAGNWFVWLGPNAATVSLGQPGTPPKVTRITSTGLFTRDPLSTYAIVEMVGAGAGGGYGFGAAGVNTVYIGQAGSSGAYVKAQLTAAQIGASQTVTIGAGGSSNTVPGGATTFGSLLTANGGTVGTVQAFSNAASGIPAVALGNNATPAGFAVSVGLDLGSKPGNRPTPGFASLTPPAVFPANGADSQLGKGGQAVMIHPLSGGGNIAAQPASANSGGGGSGDSTYGIGVAGSGSTPALGGSGLCIITEYYN
jgi:hypothetical protein